MNVSVSPQARTVLSDPPRLFFLQHSSIFESYGGVEYYLDDLACLCSSLYGEENVASLVPERKALNLVSKPYQVHVAALSNRHWLRKFENRYSPKFFNRARRLIQSFQPTLLISCHVSLGPMVYLLHKLTGIPFITIVYGIDCWGNLYPQDEWCLQRSASIVSISRWTEGVLVRRGYSTGQIAIIHPMLGSYFEGQKLKPREPRNPFTMVTVSRLDAAEQYKGHEDVLEALVEIKRQDPALKIRYLIQGEGTDRPRLESLVTTFGLQHEVEFRSAVRDREGLKGVYEEADLFVMPSRFGRSKGRWRGEGFGIVYLEAAAFGVPSIAYRCGGATDIIEDGVNGWLVEPENISDLANFIRSAAMDPIKTIEVGKKAYFIAMERFTKKAIKKEISEALGGMAI